MPLFCLCLEPGYEFVAECAFALTELAPNAPDAVQWLANSTKQRLGREAARVSYLISCWKRCAFDHATSILGLAFSKDPF